MVSCVWEDSPWETGQTVFFPVAALNPLRQPLPVSLWVDDPSLADAAGKRDNLPWTRRAPEDSWPPPEPGPAAGHAGSRAGGPDPGSLLPDTEEMDIG